MNPPDPSSDRSGPAVAPPAGADGGAASGDAKRAATGAGGDAPAVYLEERGRRLRLIQAVSLVTIGYTAYYIWWRWTGTLNTDALWFSVPLAAAETWGFLTFIFLVTTAWRLNRRAPRSAPEGLDVAVFITTYDEPVPVIRKTAAATRRIRYPHTTYILDDGCREEVRQLARDAGAEYIQRQSSEHAKAGNLNNALGLTDEDFILQLDADHVPLPDILDRLLGWFEDEEVAFVQSPQDFYNLDSFTHVVDEEGRRMWEEQRIFFDIIQPGKDRWNAAFFCGSCGAIRRSAIEDVGGFATETITEDVETSMKLHARGWKSVYIQESLAYGLSPGSAAAYQVQRLRWGQGSMQILRKMNPLFYPGLEWRQRLSYLISLVHYFDGYQKLVFLAAPFVYFLTGVLPIRAVDFEFLVRFFPYLFLTILSFELLTRGRGYLWLSERYNMAKWPIYIRAVWGLFTTKRLEFAVTPKGDDGVPMQVYLPQLAILVLSLPVLLWATVAHSAGWVGYGAPGWRSAAFVLNAAWLGWNAYFAWEVVRASRRLRGSEEYRFREEIPLRLHRPGRAGLDARPAAGVTNEISPKEIRLLTATSLSEGDEVRLDLSLSTGMASVPGRIRKIHFLRRAGITLHEVSCDIEPTVEDAVAIELHCVHHSVPLRSGLLSPRPDLFEDVLRWMRERRGNARGRIGFPAQIGIVEENRSHLTWHDGSLEELSHGGALVMTRQRIREGDWVRFQVPGAEISGQGVVHHVAPVVTPLGERWAVGIERLEASPPE